LLKNGALFISRSTLTITCTTLLLTLVTIKHAVVQRVGDCYANVMMATACSGECGEVGGDCAAVS